MRRLVVLPIVALAALALAGVGNAGREQQELTCTGGLGTITVTVTTTTNDHSVAWGVGIADGLLGIPVSFSGSATDLATNTVLDSFVQAKGHGNGMHNLGPVVDCSSPPERATAGELGIPGIDPNDVIEFDFTAQVVVKRS